MGSQRVECNWATNTFHFHSGFAMILSSLYFSAKIFLVTDFTPGHSVSSNWSWREKKIFFSSSWMKECLWMQVVMVPIFPRKLSQLSSNRLHRVERRWGKGKDLRMFDSSILLPRHWLHPTVCSLLTWKVSPHFCLNWFKLSFWILQLRES